MFNFAILFLLAMRAANADETSTSENVDPKTAYFQPLNDLPPRPYPPPLLHQHQRPYPPPHDAPPAGFRPVPPLVPASPSNPSLSAPNLPGAQRPAGVQQPMMMVTNTRVSCHGTAMQVDLSMSAPFWGIIYPYGHYRKCLLFEGSGEVEVRLTLARGVCGDQQHSSPAAPLSPLIEHRLMVQWDAEIVEKWDSSIIVRCDRPEDYNKTISFDMGLLDLQSDVSTATHARPQMWMQIQKGEGPGAPELRGSVYLGQTLTLVFTLSHEHFFFDTNVLSCWAFDGESERPQVEWADRPQSGAGPQSLRRRSTGELQTAVDGCSVRPKIFGNFQKIVGDETGNSVVGVNTVTQYALFKAFRFPTSDLVTIQCNVQVCFRRCPPVHSCDQPYNPRTTGDTVSHAPTSRQRRSTNQHEDTDNQPEQRTTLVRSLKVHMKEEPAEDEDDVMIQTAGPARYRSFTGEVDRCEPGASDCYSMWTLFLALVFLALLLSVLVCLMLWIGFRRVNSAHRSSMTTPTK